MQYSPKLKRVMEEIKAILKKEDISGVIILHTVEGEAIVKPDAIFVKGYSEFLLQMDASYSAASIHNDRFRVLGKAAHHATPQVRDIKMAGAVNQLHHLSSMTGKMAMQLIDFDEAIGNIVEKIKSENEGGGFTSHSQQNN